MSPSLNTSPPFECAIMPAQVSVEIAMASAATHATVTAMMT
jgi:hypothetical protein